MNRNNRIFALYAELREVTGEGYTPRLLMACAESLDELVNGSPEAPEYSLRQGGLSLEARGLDYVLEEGSWELAGSGFWEDDDPTADCADIINTRSMFASIERGVFL
jgi:hypothetical protein